VSSEKAGEKHRATEREHDGFMRRLERYLTTGKEDIDKSVSKVTKGMYPDSSKKRRQQGVESDRRLACLMGSSNAVVFRLSCRTVIVIYPKKLLDPLETSVSMTHLFFARRPILSSQQPVINHEHVPSKSHQE
jgi:hypothetical protein